MELKIEKIDKNSTNYEQVVDFLAYESFNLYLDLRPKMRKLYEGKSRELMIKLFIDGFKESITEKPLIYAAYLENGIVGAGYMDRNYVNSLFVSEGNRNQKIGTNLLEKLIESCQEFKIINVKASLKAVSLYERLDFRRVQENDNGGFIPMQLERSQYGK